MFAFSHSDERLRQMRERAGATAAWWMIVSVMCCCMYFLYRKDDVTAGIVMLWFIVGAFAGQIAVSIKRKIPVSPEGLMREEYSRHPEIRKRVLVKFVSLLLPTGILSIYCLNYFILRDSSGKSTFDAITNTLIVLFVFYWLQYRKVKTKTHNAHNDG